LAIDGHLPVRLDLRGISGPLQGAATGAVDDNRHGLARVFGEEVGQVRAHVARDFALIAERRFWGDHAEAKA
jgi:hypothetical protein